MPKYFYKNISLLILISFLSLNIFLIIKEFSNKFLDSNVSEINVISFDINNTLNYSDLKIMPRGDIPSKTIFLGKNLGYYSFLTSSIDTKQVKYYQLVNNKKVLTKTVNCPNSVCHFTVNLNANNLDNKINPGFLIDYKLSDGTSLSQSISF